MADTAVVEAPVTDAVPQSAGQPFAWLDTFGLDDEATVETPLPDAATSVAVETPKQAVATDVPAKVEPTEVPSGTDPKPAADPTNKPADVAAAPAADAASEVKDDPELTAEDNELVRTHPEAERPALTDRLKKASFISQYKDPEVPAAGTVEALRKISPSSYERLESAIIEQRLAEPTKFLDDVFTRSPETYGRLLADGYEADPSYFVKRITGRDGLTPEQVQTAVEFYEANKDRVLEQPAIKELTPEQIAEVRLMHGDEMADQIELMQARAKEALAANTKPGTPAVDRTKPTAKPDAVKPAADAKPDAKPPVKQLTPEEQRALTVQRDQIWNEASGQIESYLETWADDPKNGLGLKVTPQERQLAPEVADLKDYKRQVLFEGLGDLPEFREGFAQWSKDKPECVKAVDLAIHFSNLGEKENAIEAARALLPFVEKYKQERMRAPIFARIDAQITAAAARTNPKTENDAIIPGAVVKSSPSTTSDPNRRMDDLLLRDAMNA